jgi:hypothetical protein
MPDRLPLERETSDRQVDADTSLDVFQDDDPARPCERGDALNPRVEARHSGSLDELFDSLIGNQDDSIHVLRGAGAREKSERDGTDEDVRDAIRAQPVVQRDDRRGEVAQRTNVCHRAFS